jgi:transposase-like protein
MRMEVSRLFMPDNNIVEQDHRRIKRLVRPGLGFKGCVANLELGREDG